MKNRLVIFAVAVSALLMVLACGALTPSTENVSTIEPTSTPTFSAPTVKPTELILTATPVIENNTDQNRYVVNEKQLEDFVLSPDVQKQIQTENFQAHFRSGKITISADEIRYGVLNLGQMTIEGNVTATNGVVHFNVDSIQPQNMMTAAIPTVLDQLFGTWLANYYIENIEVQEGSLIYTVRP